MANKSDSEAPSGVSTLGAALLVRDEIKRSYGKLWAIGRSLTRNAPDADDLTQTTCLRALERCNLLRSDGTNVFNWMARIMRNLHIDRMRQPASRSVSLPVELASPETEPLPRWRTVDPESINQILPRLSPRLQTVWQLGCVKRLRQREIAKRLGIPLSTVGTQVFRARAALRALLDCPVPVPG
jgi:RNA polymerase sigma-70 factor (ECF subfamily)